MQARTNGIDTHYTIAGNGPWFVLSHSLACDVTMWDPQMESLTQHYKVLRYDTRGHGKSSAPQGPYSLDMLADDLKALLDAVGASQVHFAGLSMGGMIGQTFALKYPGVLKTLVLADTTSQYAPEGAAMWEQRIKLVGEKGMNAILDGTLERWFTPGFRQREPEAVKKITAVILNTPTAGYAGCGQAISKINTTARLKDIKCPTMIVVGEQDGGTPVPMSTAMQHAKPGAELFIIKDAAHISNMEKPAAFTHVLTTFLAKHK
jgi:3-oxoadipate enol-lactonase